MQPSKTTNIKRISELVNNCTLNEYNFILGNYTFEYSFFYYLLVVINHIFKEPLIKTD